MTLRNLFPGRTFAGFLFDMDGTILSSLASAERVWGRWAQRHGLDVAAFLPTMHGKRAVETIGQLNLPGVDVQAEIDWIVAEELVDVADIHAFEGAAAFLAALPPERWTIVTSSPLVLAQRRLEVAGLPVPPRIVTAADITRGKPAPDCFLLGAERLGVAAADCLVFEDAPAGIAAGEAAGATVVVVTATDAHAVDPRHATIHDFTRLSSRVTPSGGLELLTADA